MSSVGTLAVEFEGLLDTESYFRKLPQVTKQASRLAINTVLNRQGMALIKSTMYGEVNFPVGYLNGDRLRVRKNATENDLEGIIVGRKRATSLARFAAPGTSLGNGKFGSSVRVMVKRGQSVTMQNAWLVRLRQGSTSVTEDNYNIGLAVHVKAGTQLRHKKTTHQAYLNKSKTIALLYGPSVDQVFRGVAEDKGPAILTLVAKEFRRQFDRIS